MAAKTSPLRISNARLRDREGLWDIEWSDGKISHMSRTVDESSVSQVSRTSTAAHDVPSSEDTFDAGSRLVVPQFCENHVHLDYANTAGIPRDNQSGTLFEAIDIWRERKELGLNDPAEIRTDALAAIRACVQHGVGFIRTHVDVTDPELIALRTLLEVKKDVAGWCELQIVAFPQNGIIAYPGGRKLMSRAMEMGADVVGGIPHLEPTREDGVESLRFIFDLAEQYNALVDVHCDEIDDDQSRFIDVMAAETTKRGMGGRVTVSHAVAMAYYSPGYLARLMIKLKASGMGFAIAPRENLQLQGRGFGSAMPRGVAPVREIAEFGMRIAFCQDSICDPWYLIGDGNPLRNLDTGLHVSHMLTASVVDRCLDMITINPAINMGLQDRYGIEKRKPANLIVVNAKSDREALRTQPAILLSIHNGQEVFHQSVPRIEWSDGSTTV